MPQPLLAKSSSLTEALPLPQGSVVSIIGSGGKTSLMYSLARIYAQKYSVVCTTTTKLWQPTQGESSFALEPQLHSFIPSKTPGFLTIARTYDPTATPSNNQLLADQGIPQTKVLGYAPEELEKWWSTYPADILLVEADGSAGRPLKAHSPKEPVIPANTQMVIAVQGLWGLGKPLTQEHVWRPEIFARISSLAPGDVITPKALATVILHPEGIFAKVPGTAQKILFLNGLEQPQAKQTALNLARLVLEHPTSPINMVCMGEASHPEKECLCLYPA